MLCQSSFLLFHVEYFFFKIEGGLTDLYRNLPRYMIYNYLSFSHKQTCIQPYSILDYYRQTHKQGIQPYSILDYYRQTHKKDVQPYSILDYYRQTHKQVIQPYSILDYYRQTHKQDIQPYSILDYYRQTHKQGIQYNKFGTIVISHWLNTNDQ